MAVAFNKQPSTIKQQLDTNRPTKSCESDKQSNKYGLRRFKKMLILQVTERRSKRDHQKRKEIITELHRITEW